ncbi:hypothetical protein SASPL_148576 [Salvia splendens]|uniref:AB hydrolase-1 domain-containing protein n=1 Tax=Salvia splendens TaxID=180675 RepID=A0A8X8WA68_SALSN|nr:2-hydroxy-6-oxononadienedioate/2-hydroxy-6-oxononatrienedioate hydrolase 2-like [Salvia splendens]KAG6390831.1 hypothetical protein SASPL_148576 [Salvia splendens]
MSICGVHCQFIVPNSHNPKSFHHVSYALTSQNPISKGNFVTRASAASAPPLGGDYSEKPTQKARRIAGIDQDEIEDPTSLADSDSCFCTFNGLQIHHKICDSELSEDTLQEGLASHSPNYRKRLSYPMILLHGFGASVYSWSQVMKPLAKATGSKVLAFDRPAFGLTSRVAPSSGRCQDSKPPLNPYSMMFSVLATKYFIDFLAADKAILVGHSAGALVALNTYFEASERVAALILVAPAILAPFAMKENQKGTDDQNQGKSSDSNMKRSFLFRLGRVLSGLTKYIIEAIMYVIKGMGAMINSLYQKALSAILRSAFGVTLIRMIIDKFGTQAVRSAWYDSKQMSGDVLQGYTKPLRVKGWDRALAEYTVAMLTDSMPNSNYKRLSEISCPVLIVTGDTDRLVPSWNAERLSRAIPGSTFELIKNCGHLPQEEKAEEFLSIVDKFVQQVFGKACLQAAT